MIRLTTPLKTEDIIKLNVGDKILISGTIFTARDKVHLFLLEKSEKEQNIRTKINNGIIYHCGPIIKNNQVISAGPTTSNRMSLYTPQLIEEHNIKAIIGKGGMSKEVKEALKGKAVYLSAVGGAGVLYANSMKVKSTYKKEFGMAEAIWEFEVKDFPVIVSIDAKGNSLYDKVYNKSKEVYEELIK
ncbi:fumarate hydratase [archaeon]|jgi:fumarate hydratase subunit beta|nr:fumarate hydratase [archaeon]MBT3451063.1 fumarate hydratase [archaeon]MBT6869153.1 fumarate hydratase [archaeon]MBT7192800.1 fumarate hydratase [archaeon]MBT7381340.1 fumarate hydratase [archaeon]